MGRRPGSSTRVLRKRRSCRRCKAVRAMRGMMSGSAAAGGCCRCTTASRRTVFVEHQFLTVMLGVRRPTATVVLHGLQEASSSAGMAACASSAADSLKPRRANATP